MNTANGSWTAAGIRFSTETARRLRGERRQVLRRLAELGLSRYVEEASDPVEGILSAGFRLRQSPDAVFSLSADSTGICDAFDLDPFANPQDLEREIWLAMLACPVTIDFPSFAEIESAVRIRMNIVAAARKTFVRFDTMQVDRPTDYWTWDDDLGFLLNRDQPLARAIEVAMQPGAAGRAYAFSCKRAAEYLVLLGIAKESELVNPALHRRLVKQSRTRALRGDDYDNAYLQKIGTLEDPLPPRFFIPGDRVWFRNPDKFSSDITGFEGSFTVYLGGGRFPNFWKKGRIETLITKCLIIFFWREAVYQDAAGEWQVDEPLADRLVEAALRDP
ncbi:MAG TPA: hypothetical protein VFG20_03510, partial [Planctomycetaceae bacterium]|nr:hypothetical protein [Planctomycetaceae bacterium]